MGGPWTILQLLEAIQMEAEIVGNRSAVFSRVVPAGEEAAGGLVWSSANSESELDRLLHSEASVIVCRESLVRPLEGSDACVVGVSDPRLAFARAMGAFFRREPSSELNETAWVHPEAVIGRRVSIGANATIGRCAIEDDCVIAPNVTLYDDVRLGRRVTVHSGSVLGLDGFGFARSATGYEKIEHVGGLVIGDDVEVFANVVIARGALTETKVGNGTKINSLAHIGHNSRIGAGVLVGVGAKVCGSVEVGDGCRLGPGSIVRDNVSVGSNAVLGLGAVLTKDLPEGEVWVGVPAEFFRSTLSQPT